MFSPHVDIPEPGTVPERKPIEQYIRAACVVRFVQDPLFQELSPWILANTAWSLLALLVDDLWHKL